MAELPQAINNAVLDWSSGGTKTEPSGAKKAAGHSLNGSISSAETNWRWNAEGEIIDWLRENSIRTFDTLPSAISGTSEGDIFRLKIDQTDFYTAEGSQTTQQGSSFEVHKVCTDGELLYYLQDTAGETTLYATTAEPGAPSADWSTALVQSPPRWRDLDTDGTLVAGCAERDGIGDVTFAIWLASTGALLFSIDTNEYSGCCCATDATEQRVFFCRGADVVGADAVVRKWTPGGGAVTFYTVTGADTYYVVDVHAAAGVLAVYYTTDGAGDSENLLLLDIDTAAVIADVGLGSITNGTAVQTVARLHYDGLRAWVFRWVDTSNIHLERFTVNPDTPAYTVVQDWALDVNGLDEVASLPSQEEINLAVTDHFVITHGADWLSVFNKATGDLVWRWDMSSTATPNGLCTDGLRLWATVETGQASSNYLSTLPLPRTTGLWLRQGAGTTTGSERRTTRRLAIPADGTGGVL